MIQHLGAKVKYISWYDKVRSRGIAKGDCSHIPMKKILKL